ncbi:MAG: hypothetical protein AAGD01_05075 [Acidobacteriota bacterium]
MSQNRRPVMKILIAGALGALVLPLLIFLAVGLSKGMGLGAALAALGSQLGAPRLNLLVCAGLGLVPVGLLALVLFILQKIVPSRSVHPSLALGGLLPILLVSAWAHWDFWPRFLPSQSYPGFPHGLGLVIAPLFFAPVAMALGLTITGLLTRDWKGKKAPGPDRQEP